MVVESTRAFFGESTPLLNAARTGELHYEKRPQQEAMALAVAAHLEEGKDLCVEAPTGVGKTFAYLVPALFFAKLKKLPVVVSTHTISLQEQILQKDIPLLADLTGTNTTAAVAKGRANYVCLRRLNALGNVDQEELDLGTVSHIAALCRWSRVTETGSRSELDPQPTAELWETVCCERGNCLNAQCRFFRRCFLMKARRALQHADLIVANHALFFSDLAMRTNSTETDAGILPQCGALVLDEAHTIEDCACNHLGISVSSFTVQRLLNRLYDPERGTGILGELTHGDARGAVVDAQRRSSRFFNRLVEWLEPQKRNPLRYTVPGHITNYLDACLLRVENTLEKCIPAEQNDETQAELAGILDQLHAQRHGLQLFLSMAETDYVYWFERFGRNQRVVSMNAVPVQVGPKLKESLFSQHMPIIVTSATLAISNDMEFFKRRIGADSADSLILDSPFDFGKQVTIHIPSQMPTPKNQEQFLPQAAERIQEFVTKTNGRAFVLFTSYAMLHDMADLMQNFFEEQKLTLLVQGDGMPRSKMLEAFRRDVSSVLFGTASFWTGVDVPGEALSNVIIVRLPFSVPDHPLVAARLEQAQREGKNAFREYSLPDAILRFRQGFGRLIRTREDTGIVVVLDSRIVNTWYGKAFLKALPECTMEIT